MTEKINIVQEEQLCEVVRSYPVIYDKSHKGYKERDAVANAWKDVANSLEFIPNGKHIV